MTHRIGDRVRVDCLGSSAHGEETTVLSGITRGTAWSSGDYLGHEVDIPLDQPNIGVGNCIFEPHELIPIDDDASWDEIERSTGWKPSVLETI